MTTMLDEVLEAWEYTRAGVIEEAEVIPEDAYAFRPTDASRTVAELIIHIVESGRLAAGELTRPDGDFTRQSYRDHIREHAGDLGVDRPKTSLITLLRESGDEDRGRIRSVGELAMLQSIRRFDGVRGTRLAWLNHAIEHESYHRGQLALYARLAGQVPALTRRIQGAS